MGLMNVQLYQRLRDMAASNIYKDKRGHNCMLYSLAMFRTKLLEGMRASVQLIIVNVTLNKVAS